MKKSSLNFITLLLILLTIKPVIGQEPYNHIQSFELYGWAKNDNNTIIMSVGRYKEQYIAEFDMETKKVKYLNDSTSLRFTLASMHGDTGVAKAGVGDIYYTYNNWKTYEKSTQILTSVIKTSTGFMGYYKSGNKYSIYYSENGKDWSIRNAANTFLMEEKDGKFWLINSARNFYISYDGGKTIIRKENFSNPTTYFTSFTPFDSLNAVGITPSNWYFTTNGGNSWITVPNSNKSIVYASKIDSIISYNSISGLQLSTDTGKTWTAATLNHPFDNTVQIIKSDKYFLPKNNTGLNTEGLQYTETLGSNWVLIYKNIGLSGLCVSSKGDNIILGNENGSVFYSLDRGRTFQTSAYLGDDIMACKVVNDTLALVADRKSNIFLSKDGGETWSNKYSNGFNYFGKKFTYSSDFKTILMMRAGQPLLSTNSGQSWRLFVSLGGTFDGALTPSGKMFFAITNGSNLTVEEISTTGSRSLINTFSEQDLLGIDIEMIDENNGLYFAHDLTNNEVYTFSTSNAWVSYKYEGKVAVPALAAGQGIYFDVLDKNTISFNIKNTSNFDNSINDVYHSSDGGSTWTVETLKPSKDADFSDNLQCVHYLSKDEYITGWNLRVYFNAAPSDSSDPVSVFKTESQIGLKAYPNPFSDYFILESDENIGEVQLYSLDGKLVVTSQINSTTGRINTSTLKAGIYFLRTKKQTIKLIKN